MTQVRGKIVVELRAPLSIGGYTAPPPFIDSASAVTSQGEPMVPASTLRGALREAVTRLLRGRGQKACTIDDPCSDEPCAICRIFGAPGPDRPTIATGASFSASGLAGRLRLADAVYPAEVEQRLRTGVGIDRQRRAATPEVLFDRMVVDRFGLKLEAPFEADLADGDFAILREATQLVDGVGGGHSRGLGEVRLSWVLDDAPAGSSRITLPAKAPAERVLAVRVTARQPLVLGDLPPTGSVQATQAFIRGSTLRGALATALAERGADDALVRRLFEDPSTALRFSDAGPLGTSNRLPLPRPLSLLRCRNAGESDHNGKNGAEFDQLLWTAITTPILREGGSVPPPRCAVCDNLLKSAGSGWDGEPARQLVTRLARDIHRGSAMPGMLYATERIAAQAAFMGTVSGVDDDALAALRRLEGASIRVGRGRTRGQGLVDVTFLPLSEIGHRSLARRRKTMLENLEPWVRAAAKLGHRPPVERWVPVLARTDLRIDPRHASSTLADQLFGGTATCVATMQGHSQRSGWNLRPSASGAHVRPLAPVVAAGSVWLFELAAEPDLERLELVELEGVGKDRHLGCGQIALFADVLTRGVKI